MIHTILFLSNGGTGQCDQDDAYDAVLKIGGDHGDTYYAVLK